MGFENPQIFEFLVIFQVGYFFCKNNLLYSKRIKFTMKDNEQESLPLRFKRKRSQGSPKTQTSTNMRINISKRQGNRSTEKNHKTPKSASNILQRKKSAPINPMEDIEHSQVNLITGKMDDLHRLKNQKKTLLGSID